ncbi:MAG: glycosyltransferase family A protein [Parcubacteria group bacterium]|jgi:glycosyltransferase involved in cell wall biosynthesis
METSVIIRTKNEKEYLENVLIMLEQQTYQDFEIIIIDDHSCDETLNIAKKHHCKVIAIPEGRFSHPYSCNLGAEYARGKYLVYLNGHSIPISKKFLEEGLKNFEDKKVAGVYSSVIAHEDGTFTDKILYNISGYTIGMVKYRVRKNRVGLLGTTNAIIRKDLWRQYRFNENINGGWGGEDSDWALHFMNLGYEIIHDPKVKVRHSHHLKFRDFLWQIGNWRKMNMGVDVPEKQRRNI